MTESTGIEFDIRIGPLGSVSLVIVRKPGTQQISIINLMQMAWVKVLMRGTFPFCPQVVCYTVTCL